MQDDRLARQLCVAALRVAPATCGPCAAYHGLRPSLCYLGLASSIQSSKAFFRPAFEPAKRTLVCGTAQPFDAISLTASCPEARLIVIDMCRTPLSLIADAKLPASVQLETCKAERLALRADSQDAVVADGFLTQQRSREWRVAVMAEWHRVLRVGASAYASVTVAAVDGSRPMPDHDNAFIESVERALVRAPQELQAAIGPDIARSVSAYLAAITSLPYRSEGDLVEDATAAGFTSASTRLLSAVDGYQRLGLVMTR